MTLPVEAAASPRVEVAVVHGPRRVIPTPDEREGLVYAFIYIRREGPKSGRGHTWGDAYLHIYISKIHTYLYQSVV
jgi:hypothetical protein